MTEMLLKRTLSRCHQSILNCMYLQFQNLINRCNGQIPSLLCPDVITHQISIPCDMFGIDLTHPLSCLRIHFILNPYLSTANITAFVRISNVEINYGVEIHVQGGNCNGTAFAIVEGEPFFFETAITGVIPNRHLCCRPSRYCVKLLSTEDYSFRPSSTDVDRGTT